MLERVAQGGQFAGADWVLMPSEKWDGDQLAQIQLAAQERAFQATLDVERWRNVVKVAQIARACGLGPEETVQQFYQRQMEASGLQKGTAA